MIKNYYKQIIKQDFINKFSLYKSKNIPTIEKITLSFGCKNPSTQELALIMVALEMITQKRSTITISRKPNILLKIQKGQPIGCKVELKNNDTYLFIAKLNLEILPKLRNFTKFKIEKQKYNFFFQLPKDGIQLQEFERSYPLLINLPILHVNILTKTKRLDQIFFLAKSLKIPF